MEKSFLETDAAVHNPNEKEGERTPRVNIGAMEQGNGYEETRRAMILTWPAPVSSQLAPRAKLTSKEGTEMEPNCMSPLHKTVHSALEKLTIAWAVERDVVAPHPTSSHPVAWYAIPDWRRRKNPASVQSFPLGGPNLDALPPPTNPRYNSFKMKWMGKKQHQTFTAACRGRMQIYITCWHHYLLYIKASKLLQSRRFGWKQQVTYTRIINRLTWPQEIMDSSPTVGANAEGPFSLCGVHVRQKYLIYFTVQQIA